MDINNYLKENKILDFPNIKHKKLKDYQETLNKLIDDFRENVKKEKKTNTILFLLLSAKQELDYYIEK